MQTSFDPLRRLVGRYEPRVPLDQLIFEVNKLYHYFEAEDYDTRHPEVHQQLPPLWQGMFQFLMAQGPARGWRVLDFGCGTGFEAAQFLSSVPADRIQSLTCYDASAAMLARCRARLAGTALDVLFLTNPDDITKPSEPYDLVLTNSLLHHLSDPVRTLSGITSVIASDGWWLSGHEPSRRYFQNRECQDAYHRCHAWMWRRKLLSPSVYIQRLRMILGLGQSPASATAAAAYQTGLFSRKPSPAVVGQLVDVHVPHSEEEAVAGRGFDFEELQNDLAGYWNLRWFRSYAYMGPYYEGRLPDGWRAQCARLARTHPRDGANFCCVWSRK